MKLRVVILFLTLGVLVLIVALPFVSGRGGSKAGDRPGTGATSGPDQPQAATAAPSAEKAVEAVPAREAPSGEAPASDSELKHQAYVAARCSELEDLATDDRPESLATILSELTNRDPEIRSAALSAAKQFGSREAIPSLMDAASQTEDLEEKLAFKEAIKFLQLPSLSELAARANTNSPPASR